MIAARIWLLNAILTTVCLLLIVNNVLSKCNDEIDCHFNGVCRNDVCVCNDGWQGSKCQFCAGKIKLTGKSGIITDGIGNYSLGLKCTWLIQAEHNETISLYFNEFATECNWDYFYVYDGDSVKAPLIAAFNGIMFHKTYQIKRVPEIKLKSGFGLLHFASDDAYNMTGFNISYNMNKCPSDKLDTECSNHGACTSTNDCTCSAQWSGEACQNSFCPNDCGHHGTCNYEKHRCDCDRGFAGPDCSQPAKYGFWQAFQHSLAVPSTSHSSVIWNHSLLILSGYNFQKRLENHNFEINKYNLATKEWTTFLQPQEEKDTGGSVSEKMTLLPRYSHAAVVHNDKLYVYGGVTVSRTRGEVPTNEFLQFDLKTNSWSTISVTNCNRCVSPFRVFGHTMNLFENRRLIIIFGFSPDFGFLNHVQEYDLESRKWSIVDTKGFPVKGTYGHTTVFDTWTNKFFVYGGIVVSSDSNQKLTNRIYSYDPKTQTWMLLSSSPSARFFHSSVFLSPGLMLVFGGNTHNDTSHNYGAKCYSSESLVYDTMCDSWYSLKSPTNDLLQTDVARFGHSSNTYNNSVYVYGGFNGLILNDLLQFHAGQCNEFVNENDCLNSRPGIKCIWNSTKSACVMLTNDERFRNIMHTTDGNFAFCEQQNRSMKTKSALIDPEQCATFSDCLSCNETSRKCVWCTNGICSYEKCREQHQPITDCGRFHFDAYPYCSHLKTCKSCDLNKKCAWNPNEAKCESISEISMSLEENFSKTTYCDTSCDTFQSCMNCTMEKCIWCQNEQRCVDKNAYTLTFPYGQCREWTTMPLKCRTADNSKDTDLVDECGAYKSCRHCLENPSCGWCDSGSNTGLGTCLSGGYSGVHNREFAKMCPSSTWHFTSCPKCQCNGHSHCLNNSSKCEQPCQDLATGTHCDKCSIGYWGNPQNGGICQPCDCNGRATLCHPETGKCLCTMKGVTGDRCNKCDITNHYHEDVYKKGVCYYDLTIDYQFTFNLSKKEDRYYSQINFRNSPIKPDIDADFQITSSVSAKMNITIRQYKSEEKVLFSSQNFTSFRYRFTKSDYNFGHGDNLSLTTFYVYVYDFKPPLWIQISFSQYPKLNLQQFFITFTTCFLLLLMVAILLWRIKQRFDMYRRRQRLFVEMEQMASRPFAKVCLECNSRPPPSAKESKNRIATNPVALEPCEGNKAAVLTILVRLPVGSGETQYTQPGQPAGLAIACALVSLSPNSHKNSLDSFSTMKPSNNSRLFSRKFRRSAPNT